MILLINFLVGIIALSIMHFTPFSEYTFKRMTVGDIIFSFFMIMFGFIAIFIVCIASAIIICTEYSDIEVFDLTKKGDD